MVPSILQQIVAQRKATMAQYGHAQGLSLPNSRGLPLVPFCTSPTIICEVKRQSPSRGVLAVGFDPLEQAAGYLQRGATACSVLTEEHYFGGGLMHLRGIKERFPQLALLRKDFLFDWEDIAVSYRAGADAVLLIAAILSVSQIADFSREAERLGMRALVEVHSEEEIEKVRPVAPHLVGVNCRDLKDFSIDTLRPLALVAHIDWQCDLVFESGIWASEQVRMARAGGFDSLLVGEAVMRNDKLIPKLIAALSLDRRAGGEVQSGNGDGGQRAGLVGERVPFWSMIAEKLKGKRPLVKICGITNREDAEYAVECGADILGFVLCASPRRASVDMVRSLRELLVLKVAVIDGEEALPDGVIELYRAGCIDALQVHGGEVRARGEELGGCPYYQALRVQSAADYAALERSPSARMLIDSHQAERKGGTGVRVSDALLAAHPQREHLWLAGGVGSENIARIITHYQPELVDSSSKLESAPGRKDKARVAQFFSALRRACQNSITTDAERHGGQRTASGATDAADKGRSGFFGRFGGRFVADLLWEPLQQLEEAFARERKTSSFQEQLARFRHQFIGRPTPLYKAQNLTDDLGGAQIYFKLEGLAHSGAHKINNAIGQALIAKAMGKRRIIAETGAGQHGVATATVCAALRLPCTVYMGAVDMRRQQPNVLRMRLLGAEVRAVESGSSTLKDAVNAALRDWASSYEDTHYLLGSALGPHPFPTMVAAFQAVIGEECAGQASALGFSPDYCIACVGGGSNAIGFFAPWLECESPQLIGVEAGGRGAGIGEHASRIATANGDPFSTESDAVRAPHNTEATVGIAQGYKSYFLQRSDGQLAPTHSISAGLDYPGIGPQLADLAERGRVRFVRASDDEALAALQRTAEAEGVLAALESAHALAYAIKLAPSRAVTEHIIVNISGSGDKDLFIIAKATSPAEWRDFLEREVASIE